MLLALVTCVACAAPAPAPPTVQPPAATAQPAPTVAAPPTAPAVPAPTTATVSKPATSNGVNGEIVIFAASSLTDAFQEIGGAFQQANASAKVTFNFGASSQLRTQLEQGARADVFASADQAQMDNAKKADTIAGQDRVFARNRLVLIVPRGNPAHISSVKDLANDGLKFVTAQPSVPIGQYTATLLDKASSDPAYGSDFKAKVEGNIVSREDNVRQIVAKVQLGEADGGIVYTTDVAPQVRDQLQQIAIPDALQTIATYPIAVAKGGNAAGGEAFVTFVLGPSGQAILGKWGFLSLVATAQPAAGATFSPELRIGGIVANPRTLTRDDLLALPQETVQV
jgi:molybdate transport system substrate-binding protein